LGGRAYRGCENFGGRVHLFGVLTFIAFLLTSFAKIWECASKVSSLNNNK
jgi:hypothetical protein